MNVRLRGLFSLRSPLTHIGEAISTTSYLVQEPVIQPDGAVEEVFSYSGNAWRGALRDAAAVYMLDRLGGLQVPRDSFHLLFSGGRIGGAQTVDVHRARQWRRAIPMLALFGGGVGNQILPGKLRVGNAYPLCREALPVLPADLADDAARVSYRALTFEKSFSRKDDTKDERLTPHLAGSAPALTAGQASFLPEPEPARKPKGDEGGAAQQMRMTVELLAPGARLYQETDALDVSEVELGALVSALHRWAVSPHIGGQANRGHGRVALTYHLVDLDTGERVEPFLSVDGGAALLSPPAAAAKDAYDQSLQDQYDGYLAARESDLRQLLGA